MNKIILYNLCLIYFFVSNYAHSATAHYNYIYFTGDTKSVIFQMTNHFITKGQPFEGISPAKAVSFKKRTPATPPKGLKIRAGRKGSRQVVGDVEYVNGYDIFGGIVNKELGKSTFNYEPGKLNFAVQGNLIINGKQFNDIILAQGHTGFSNNWWFAGRHCTKYDNNEVYAEAVDCIATDGTDWCFTRGAISAFSITKPNRVKLSKKTCDAKYNR
ncbi:MAG: hypothetical protein OXC48_02650 [Endozoicomonadaceae bacterium]|nr:hypothetical protein [Endozoicomonadaceae bacterium]